LPDAVEKAGLFGPNMIALTAYLKGLACPRDFGQ
jgi:hypothetical protein